MKIQSWAAVAGALVLSLSGCARERLIGRTDLKVVEASALPAPTRGDLILEQRSYVIGPLDKVAVNVYGVPELSQTVSVDASGEIALPLIGVIEASGKSTSQLASLIADRLRGRYVRDPNVTVSADTISQVITVDGQVTEPGLYPVIGRMTLLRSIASAKGMSEFADSSYVVVFRRVGNQQMAALYDVRAIRQGLYADPEVFANDVVEVGESNGRRTFKDIISGSGLIIAPIVALLQ